MVSAELALAIPTVVAVLGLCLGAMQVGIDRVRCVQAAGVAVRAVVRGDAPDRARSDAMRVAPPGSVVSWTGGEVVTVRVTHRPRILGLVDLPFPVGAESVSRVEQAVS